MGKKGVEKVKCGEKEEKGIRKRENGEKGNKRGKCKKR